MKQRKLGALLALFAALFIASVFHVRIQSPRSRCRASIFSRRLLPNGMRVLSAVDHSSPTVAIQVWYHVGSKDDPAGPQRLRASLRTHNVQGDEEHEVGDDGSFD